MRRAGDSGSTQQGEQYGTNGAPLLGYSRPPLELASCPQEVPMNRPGKVTIASALLTFAFTASISGAGPASAQKLDSGTFHDDFSDTIEDFCDVPGLSVDFSSTVDGRFLDRLQGRHS